MVLLYNTRQFCIGSLKQTVMVSCLVVFASTLVFSAMPHSWAQNTTNSQIVVQIDKERYNRGDIMITSGSVKNVVDQLPLTLQILDSANNLVHVEQVLVATDGQFSLPIKIDGSLWNLPGQYSMIVQYGFKHVSAMTKFQFEQEDIPTSGVFNVKDLSSGQNFDLNYAITGGAINSIVVDLKNIALVVHLDTKYPGVVHLKIPRLLLDAKKSGNADESFLVFVNDDEIISFHEENSDSEYRVLDIPVVNGDYKIEIIGTQVVPEFERISGLILGLAIILEIFVIPKTYHKNL